MLIRVRLKALSKLTLLGGSTMRGDICLASSTRLVTGIDTTSTHVLTGYFSLAFSAGVFPSSASCGFK